MPPAGIIALGLVTGALAGINSLGMVLLWRTTRLVNLAQPSMGLVGGVLTGLLVVSGGWSFWWAAPVGLLLGAVLGLGADRIVFRRLQDAPRAVLLIATVGLAQVFGGIQAALPFAFGGQLPTYTIDLGFTLDVFPVLLLGPHLLTLIALPLVLLATYLFLHRSRIGLAALALGQDAERARALGVRADLVRAIVWAVAGALATVSGILAIPVLGFNLGGGLGPTLLLFALAPAVFAGLRSLAGAALGALALGVGFQLMLWYTTEAGNAQLLLAGSIVVAVALQRRRLGRAEVAVRASSWEAAATPRPLPWDVARSPRVRTAGIALIAVALTVLPLLPLAVLSPSQDVLFAASTALALGALAVAVAWMFAGEVVLGHWGLAGLGAALALLLPGHWMVGAAVAGITMAAGGAVLALASRRQSSLSFAVLGLAAAAAAPVAVATVSETTLETDAGAVGAMGAILVLGAVVAVLHLRGSTAGARMVAARDDPERGPWLGAHPLRARVLALTLSGGLAGLAGALYVAGTSGLVPEAFNAERSLDLLAMAAIGGLGSPVGALLGAAALQVGRFVLPGPWQLLVSGAGILVVVIFMPSGLSNAVTWVRDRAVRLLGESPAATPAGKPLESPAEQAVRL